MASPRQRAIKTPNTRRILDSTKAAVLQGEASLALAFAKSVQAHLSPRMLSPKKPLSTKSPRNLASLPFLRPTGSAVTEGDLPAHRPSVFVAPSAAASGANEHALLDPRQVI